jgi:hypothetical protein
MSTSNNYTMTMESGAVYTVKDNIVVIEPSHAPAYAIKAWQLFAFDPEEIEKWDDLPTFMATAERKEPAVGRRVLVYGKDGWRVSTNIVKLEAANA